MERLITITNLVHERPVSKKWAGDIPIGTTFKGTPEQKPTADVHLYIRAAASIVCLDRVGSSYTGGVTVPDIYFYQYEPVDLTITINQGDK